MKAAVLYEVRQPLRIEEIEIPEVSDEDVLIKVAVCGVCHTDLKVIEGRTRFTPPTVLGHEVAGTVERVGSHCQDFKAGDPVIIGMPSGANAQAQSGVVNPFQPHVPRPGIKICFLRGPQGISIELLDRDPKYA